MSLITHQLWQLIDNRLSLYLFWTWWRSKMRPVLDGSVASLTRAIDCGSLAKEAAPHRLLVTLPQFLTLLDETINQLLTCHHFTLTNNEWISLLQAIQWRVHITNDIGDLPVNNHDALDVTVSRISQYWSWLLVQTMPIRQCPSVDSSLTAALVESMAHVSEALSSTLVAGTVVSRRLRRSLYRAEPFTDATQSLRARWISSILSTIDVSIAASQRGAELIGQFTRLISQDIVVCDELETLAKQFSKLERTLDYATSNSPIRCATTDEDNEQMLSLMDHIVVLQHYASMQQLICNINDNDGLKDDTLLADIASRLATIPTAGAALLHAYYTHGKPETGLAGCGPWLEFYLFHWELIVNLTFSPRLCLSSSNSSDASDTSSDAYRFATTAPVLTLGATSLLLKNAIALGESSEKTQRLQQFRRLLWTNSGPIQRSVFDPQLNDHFLAVDSLRRVTRAVFAALRLPLPQSSQLGNHFCLSYHYLPERKFSVS